MNCLATAVELYSSVFEEKQGKPAAKVLVESSVYARSVLRIAV